MKYREWSYSVVIKHEWGIVQCVQGRGRSKPCCCHKHCQIIKYQRHLGSARRNKRKIRTCEILELIILVQTNSCEVVDIRVLQNVGCQRPITIIHLYRNQDAPGRTIAVSWTVNNAEASGWKSKVKRPRSEETTTM
jgi:hypothetical protein